MDKKDGCPLIFSALFPKAQAHSCSTLGVLVPCLQWSRVTVRSNSTIILFTPLHGLITKYLLHSFMLSCLSHSCSMQKPRTMFLKTRRLFHPPSPLVHLSFRASAHTPFQTYRCRNCAGTSLAVAIAAAAAVELVLGAGRLTRTCLHVS